MAFPNSAVTEMIATTLRNRSKEIADNVTKNNAVLTILKDEEKNRPISGGTEIIERFTFAANGNAGWYSGYDLLPVAAQDTISGAQFYLKQIACPVVISGLERLQNSGKEQITDLLSERVDNAKASMANLIAEGIYSDGTGYGGKQLVGLGAAVVANPTTGTYGGIDRATTIGTFWRNAYTGSLGAQTTITITPNMNTLYNSMVRGKNRPKVILAANAIYGVFEATMQGIQRITDDKLATMGFENVRYKNAKVVLDGGIGGFCPANVMYFLNTDYIFFRTHSDRDMVDLGGERTAINQDASCRILAWAGAFTCSGAQFHGYFQGS